MKRLPQLISMLAFSSLMGLSPLVRAETTGQYVDDATLTAKVKSALLADTRMKAVHVSVKTNQGIVQLTGTADSKDLESAAIKIANQVEGVKSVKDDITLTNTTAN